MVQQEFETPERGGQNQHQDDGTPHRFNTNNNNRVQPEIKVGKFMSHTGETRYYALVPDTLISSKTEIDKLMKHWKLSLPEFILEMNPSLQNDVITKDNVPYMLQDVFFRKGDRPEPGISASTRSPQDWIRKLLHNQLQNVSDSNHNQHTNDPIHSQLTSVSDHKQQINVVNHQEINDSNHQEGINIPNHNQPTDEDLEWVNKYVVRKTVEALSSLVSVADMMGGWILCRGKPAANEKMLEAAINNTGSKPVILVVDDIKNHASKQDYEYLEEKAKTIDEASSQSQPLSLHSPPRPESASRRTTWSFPQDHSEDPLVWKIPMGEPKWEGDFPWLQGTHFIFSERFGAFNAETLETSCASICIHGDSTVNSEPGTGVLIRDAVSSIRPCLLFNNTGAQTQAYARLIEKIRSRGDKKRNQIPLEVNYRSWPSLCIACTCSLFGSKCMHKVNSTVSPEQCSTEEPNEIDRIYDELLLDLREDAWGLQRHANLGSGENGLSIADVLQIVDLYCKNPRLFTNVVIPVDPLNDKPDVIVKNLMLSTSRSQLERKEVGAGDADDNAVERAWKLHHQLGVSKKWKETWRTFFYSCFILAGICTTLIAVLYNLEENGGDTPGGNGGNNTTGGNGGNNTSEENGGNNTSEENGGNNTSEENSSNDTLEESDGNPFDDWATWIALILAAVSSLSVSILNLTGADSQLIKIQTAQAKIVFEIFQYRLRVGKYSFYSMSTRERTERDEESPVRDPSTVGDDSRRNNSTNASTRLHLTRERFSEAIKDISMEIASLDLYADPLAQGELTKSNRSKLEVHVAKTLRLKKTDEKAVSGIITSWDYHNLRIRSLLNHLEEEEDRIRLWTRILQVLSMVSSSVTVVLIAAGKMDWVPITVAGATGFSQYLKVYDLERRFETISRAAREVGALDNYWQSLSDVDKYSRSCIGSAVATCEDIALQYETTSVIKVDKASLGMDESNQTISTQHSSPRQQHSSPRQQQN